MISFFQTKFFSTQTDKNSQESFTLVELLVVISISMVIGAAAIMNFTGGKRSNSVSRAADVILTEVRGVQNKATTIAQGNGQVSCGYGIHYQDPTSFQTFKIEPDATTDCKEINTPSSSDSNRTYSSSRSVDLKLVELKKPNITKIDGSFSDIYFVPPEGLVFIDGERTTAGSSTIVVCERTRCSANNKKIRISVGGKIIRE